MKPFEDEPNAHDVPLIIGHRGAAAVAPENTLISFKRAIEDGADGIEFDVRLALDNVPVVIHDASLLRTGLREGAIASLPSTELSKVDTGTWFNLRYPTLRRDEYAHATIPTLAEVFELFRESNAVLYVEMKCSPAESQAIASEVAKLVREYDIAGHVVIESFTLDSIIAIKRISTEMRTAALFEPKLVPPSPSMRTMIARAVECKADELALHRLLATRRTTAEAKRLGMETVVWTVDNPAWLARARRYGIRAVITNNPAVMKGKIKNAKGKSKAENQI